MATQTQTTPEKVNGGSQNDHDAQGDRPKSGVARLTSTRSERGLYRDAGRRFVRNKLSVFGFILVILLIFLAIFADNWFIALPLGNEPEPLIAK